MGKKRRKAADKEMRAVLYQGLKHLELLVWAAGNVVGRDQATSAGADVADAICRLAAVHGFPRKAVIALTTRTIVELNSAALEAMTERGELSPLEIAEADQDLAALRERLGVRSTRQ